LFKGLSKLTIKPPAAGKVKLVLQAALLFAVGFLLGVNLIIPLLLVCALLYLKRSSKDYNLLNLSLLFVIIFTASHFIIKQGQPLYYIPFAAVAMLAAILFEELPLSLLVTLLSSFSVGYLARDVDAAILFSISGMFSIVFVRGARKRMTLIRAGLAIGLIQAAALFFIDHYGMDYPQRYLLFVVNGAVSSIIVLGVLPIFEYLFKTVTNISLLELADFSQPLLQRMMMEAPGTYHHSLIVGNLSEAACSAVGANALLARIGAYYHDIGKLEKPEYFSENQELQTSKHEALTPTMSKMVIMNHVNGGLELAKKYKLNARLVDFIKQHHGTSLVYYFYRRALENQEENDQAIKEEGFRYPGPKPNTKETAIVLLADSVEAASRALKEPTPANIKDVVYNIINNKFIDGQLDECDLTLKDLEKISAVFVRILSGIFHARIAYPGNHTGSGEPH